MTTTVCMIYRDDGSGHRRAAYHHASAWWYAHGYDVRVGDTPGAWSRPRTFNRLAWDARPGILILANADVIPEPGAVHEAVYQAAMHQVTVYPFTRYVELSEGASWRVMAEGAWHESDVTLSLDNSVGPILVVDRSAYLAIGGMDPRFLGWGFDDVAWALQSEALLGPNRRTDGVCVHLYHRPDASSWAYPDHPGYQANLALCQRYEDAAGERAVIQSIREEAPSA